MWEEDDEKCFRCGARPKVMITPVIDNKPVHLCIDCYRDLILCLGGCVVNPLVKVQCRVGE